MEGLKLIHKMPTILDNVHQSVFRSDGILKLVLKMIERGDSKESIFEIVEYLSDYPLDAKVCVAAEDIAKGIKSQNKTIDTKTVL